MTDPIIGRTVQDYQIVSLLGKGGMGNVYLAKHPLIGKKIAVKALRPEYTDDKEILGRFFREAKAVNDIQHENVVDITNFVTDEATGTFYILMEYLEGETLADVIDREAPLAPKRIGHIALQICSALSLAHQKGIIHRDLKSDNIFLITRAGQRDFVKLLDFGLAKLQESPHQQISKAGIALGTPAYMSPEQAAGDPIDQRSDIYSLGVILYEAATKTLPYNDATNQSVMRKHLFAPLPRPKERYANIDPRLEAVIIRCLEKAPEDRYASMKEVASAVSEACGLEAAPYIGSVFTSTRVPAVPRQTKEAPPEAHFIDDPTDPEIKLNPSVTERIVMPVSPPIDRGEGSMPAVEVPTIIAPDPIRAASLRRWAIMGSLALVLFFGAFAVAIFGLSSTPKSTAAPAPLPIFTPTPTASAPVSSQPASAPSAQPASAKPKKNPPPTPKPKPQEKSNTPLKLDPKAKDPFNFSDPF